MSDRILKTWKVLNSIESDSGDLCVDIFQKEDESFGFEEFRRDVEDMGKWTGINYYSTQSYRSQQEAMAAAEMRIGWVKEFRVNSDA